MSASSSISQVAELPVYKGSMVKALKIFNLSRTEYEVLLQCDQNDINHRGLSEHHILPSMKPYLDALALKDMMEYSSRTRTWILTEPGRIAVMMVPLYASALARPAKAPARVLHWPRNTA